MHSLKYKTLMIQGIKAYQNENYLQAIELFNETIAENPTNDLAFYNRGLSYYEMKEYKQSLKDLDEALRINPKHNPDCYYSRGLTLLQMHKYKEALKDFTKYLSFKEDAEAYCSQGIAFAMLGQFENALKCYETSLNMDPNNDYTLYNQKISQRELQRRRSLKEDNIVILNKTTVKTSSDNSSQATSCSDLENEEKKIKEIHQTEYLVRKSSFDDIFTFCYGDIK